MGISATNARLLLDCRRAGVDFGRTLMLGRQNVYLSAPEYDALLASMGWKDGSAPTGAVSRSGEFAEPFFRALGATTIDSMDASSFEGATLVHDLNTPVPRDWWERYDVVYDGGTLEHVFDYPRALTNALRLLKVGGRLILHTPSNNMLGHGLYQFSPELFFRVLDPANGLRCVRILAVETGVAVRWYECIDPALAGVRGEMANRVPVWLHVEAEKTGPTPEVLRPVQQSDYQARWNAPGPDDAAVRSLADPHHWVNPGLRRFLLGTFPGLTRRLERFVGIYLARGNSFRNRGAYRRWRG
ncbi:MAG: hypothetical protein JNL97_04360 [Verrucomicrobiales bacterium]|nr:hypothetical protein [Verrucomicrobiales bacterium]